MIDEIEKLLAESLATEFTPYVELNKEADALTAYFKPAADYSRRLTDHVTLYLSIDSDELVGCRIKGVSGILANLPNYLDVDHDDIQLSVMFLPYLSSADDEQRKMLNELARTSRDSDMRVPALA